MFFIVNRAVRKFSSEARSQYKYNVTYAEYEDRKTITLKANNVPDFSPIINQMRIMITKSNGKNGLRLNTVPINSNLDPRGNDLEVLKIFLFLAGFPKIVSLNRENQHCFWLTASSNEFTTYAVHSIIKKLEKEDIPVTVLSYCTMFFGCDVFCKMELTTDKINTFFNGYIRGMAKENSLNVPDNIKQVIQPFAMPSHPQ